MSRMHCMVIAIGAANGLRQKPCAIDVWCEPISCASIRQFPRRYIPTTMILPLTTRLIVTVWCTNPCALTYAPTGPTSVSNQFSNAQTAIYEMKRAMMSTARVQKLCGTTPWPAQRGMGSDATMARYATIDHIPKHATQFNCGCRQQQALSPEIRSGSLERKSCQNIPSVDMTKMSSFSANA